MLKSLSILGKIYTDDTNVFTSIITDKYENWPDYIHSMCLADFASSYVSKKARDVEIEPHNIINFTLLVSNIDNVEPNLRITVVKNELGEMRKCNWPCVICFQKVSKLKSPEEHCLRHLQLYMPWRK